MIEPDGPSCGSSSHCRVIFSLFLLLLASSSSLPYSIKHPSKTIPCYLELQNVKKVKSYGVSGGHLFGLKMSTFLCFDLEISESGYWPGSGPGAWQFEIENVGKLID